MPYRGEHGFPHLSIEANERDLSDLEYRVANTLATPYKKHQPQHDRLVQEHGGLSPYEPKELAADRRMIVELGHRDEGDDTVRGRILEAFLAEHAPSLGWFGTGSHMVTTSEYDNRCNATDMVLVLPGLDGRPVYLAVDVTTSTSGGVLSKKQQQLKQSLETGSLSTIKYFHDAKDQAPITGVRKLEHIPRVVIGVPAEAVSDLCKPLEPYLQSGQRHTGEAGLRNHPLKNELISSTVSQLEQQILFLVVHYFELISKRDPHGFCVHLSKTRRPELFDQFSELIRSLAELMLAPDASRVSEQLSLLRQAGDTLEPIGQQYGVDFPLSECIEKISAIRDQLAATVQNKNGSEKHLGDSGAATVRLSDREWTRADDHGFTPWFRRAAELVELERR